MDSLVYVYRASAHGLQHAADHRRLMHLIGVLAARLQPGGMTDDLLHQTCYEQARGYVSNGRLAVGAGRPPWLVIFPDLLHLMQDCGPAAEHSDLSALHRDDSVTRGAAAETSAQHVT